MLKMIPAAGKVPTYMFAAGNGGCPESRHLLDGNHEDMKQPVLVLGFNRPDLLAQVAQRVATAGERTVYAVIDGPRANTVADEPRCARSAEVARSYGWRVQERPSNLGCRQSVSQAISMFFELEESGIILEDDCLPDAGFFDFCDELLPKFERDERVFQLCGTAPKAYTETRESYSFSSYNYVWGWATWRDRWQKYRPFTRVDSNAKLRDILESVPHSNRAFVRYWLYHFQLAKLGRVDSWAYPWTRTMWEVGGAAVVPSANLVRNLGFGPHGLHTATGPSGLTESPEGLEWPLRHPSEFRVNVDSDLWADKNYFDTRSVLLPDRIARYLRRQSRRLGRRL